MKDVHEMKPVITDRACRQSDMFEIRRLVRDVDMSERVMTQWKMSVSIDVSTMMEQVITLNHLCHRIV